MNDWSLAVLCRPARAGRGCALMRFTSTNKPLVRVGFYKVSSKERKDSLFVPLKRTPRLLALPALSSVIRTSFSV